MAKPNPYEKEMFAGVNKTQVDDNAYTLAEIRDKFCMSDRQARALLKRKLVSGEWERVYKTINGRHAIAYRPAKTKQ